ncbi:MAG: hypothetical protein LBS50_07165 [Prevotellaceae bacterium]|jgi:hypothetical protein|nr:hypothetical protein [Prevotellaceae bacterium]
MKKISTFATVMIAAVSIGLTSCNKDEVLSSAQSAEQASIARAPSNAKYSDYILTPNEVCEFVTKDLQNSGGKFAKKQVDYAEPILFSDFKLDSAFIKFKELQDSGIIKMTDPAIYIVHFKNEGYSVVFPDKRLGEIIIHSQTLGDIAAADFHKAADKNTTYTPLIPRIHWELDYMLPECDYKLIEELMSWLHTTLMSNLLEKPTQFKHAPNASGGGGGGFPSAWSGWYTTQDNAIVDPYIVTDVDALNSWQPNYNLGTLAIAVFEFLGHFEISNNYFNLPCNWAAIKGNESTVPAPELTCKISQHCRMYQHTANGVIPFDDFGKALNILSNDFPNAKLQRLAYIDELTPVYDNLTHIIEMHNPVIMLYTGNYGLAYREELLQNDYNQYDQSGNVIQTLCSIYDSRIHYGISSSDKINREKTLRSASKNAFYYIAY